MAEKITVHIVSHSHWDREWYEAFERHRMKLLPLMDQSMELFETDPEFKHFHLDGQTIIFDDYLEVKPENKERLQKHVREGHFSAGPWYILQDEFLTSGEACVRNLLTGMRCAKELGRVCPVGYFPDAFGNAGQMPQVLKQAGMKAAAFGRGVRPVGFNNEILEMSGDAAGHKGEYDSNYSEIYWESPDGSSLLGILFANWYNNGAEIPTEPEAAKLYWEERLAKAKAFAGTNQLLFMNGSDHQPVQTDLSQAIETARKLFPEITFIHSGLEEYIDAVEQELKKKRSKTNDLSVVRGELTSQETDGRWTLANTASSWIDLKQLNRAGESALERRAEPLALIAALEGKEYPQAELRYSWKKLMQNHPHDSICGCNVDEVNAEIRTRFVKSRQAADMIFDESMQYLAEKIAGNQECLRPFVVFNTSGWERTGIVSVLVDYKRMSKVGYVEDFTELEHLEIPKLNVTDSSGAVVSANIEDLGVSFGYTLPKDRFRQPYMARQLKVTLEAKAVPAMGYRTYFLTEETQNQSKNGTIGILGCPRSELIKQPVRDSLVTGRFSMENDFVRVEIAENGSYTLTNKKTGRIYPEIGFYEETGDIGNEYIYVQDTQKIVRTTKESPARIQLVEDQPYRAAFRICHCMLLPAEGDEQLRRERKQCYDIYQRKAGRSNIAKQMEIETLLVLEKHSAGLKVETTIHNNIKDHRVRVIIPTGLQTERHQADSVFEIVERRNRHGKTWINPCGSERQQAFVAIQDESDGILAANRGLYEYEILPNEKNAIALTLLRAVGEMGDWGSFPTPNAQMQGTYTLCYEIVPFAAADTIKAWQEGYQYQSDLAACVPESSILWEKKERLLERKNPQAFQETSLSKKKLLPDGSFFAWSGDGIILTGMKQKEDSKDVIVRFVNESRKPAVLTIEKKEWMGAAYKSNVLEEEAGEVLSLPQSFCVETRPFEIVTVGIKRIY